MKEKANQIGALDAKVRLDPLHRIHGKVAIVAHWNYSPVERPEDFAIQGFTRYFDGIAPAKVLNAWGLKPDTIATKPEEIDTAVRVGCTSGARIEDFKPERLPPVPAFATVCLVELIDYRKETVFAQQVFRNTTIEPDRNVLPTDDKIVASPPYEDIEEFVRTFARD
ncbi:MAG: hypothetical protein UZ17_ACD001000991 [Acidobacteria bacterium OLB17]|nr:MAG: hypothetical protein UZ17_ACD001000991 [Acidobacteria bacterium OLB17]